MTGLTPQYLRDPIPPPRSHLYGTSSTNDLHPMRCKTQRFQNSFYPNAVNCWNDIGPDIRKLDTLNSFKSTLNGIIRPKCRSIFNIHSPDLKYLYQLRGGLSQLSAHKFRHKFRHTFENVPSPTCLCSTGAETTEHFLLYCPIFNTHRKRLMEIVNPIIFKIMTKRLHEPQHEQHDPTRPNTKTTRPNTKTTRPNTKATPAYTSQHEPTRPKHEPTRPNTDMY